MVWAPVVNSAGDENLIDIRYVPKLRKWDLLRGQDWDVKGSEESRVILGSGA